MHKYLRSGAYTDCYVTDVTGEHSHARYVEAFYTTLVFKLERLLLKWLVARPSTDSQARELAAGRLESFAAWIVEDRNPDQILMCDFRGRTRSWLMCETAGTADSPMTRLYFGSAVVPVNSASSGEAKMGLVFGTLLGFHRLYSRILLRAAAAALVRERRLR